MYYLEKKVRIDENKGVFCMQAINTPNKNIFAQICLFLKETKKISIQEPIDLGWL